MKNFSLVVGIVLFCMVTQVEADDSSKLYELITPTSKGLGGKLEVLPVILGCKYYNGVVTATVVNKSKKTQVYRPIVKAIYKDCTSLELKLNGKRTCDYGKVIEKGKDVNIPSGATKKMTVNVPLHSYEVMIIIDENYNRYKKCKIDNRKPIY